MKNNLSFPPEEIDTLYKKLNNDAIRSGYNLNPDLKFTKDIVKSLLINEKRYGYQACPCRLAIDNKEEDLDIVCPCDYRDADLNEFDTCYCGLYVSQVIVNGMKDLSRIPERRPPLEERKKMKKKKILSDIGHLKYPVWRCKVCGYLCARDFPPQVCPVCKAEKERFERLL